MIRVGIVGVTGYTGEELIGILLKHPKVKITGLFSSSAFGKPIGRIFPEFSSKLKIICDKPDIKDIAGKCDLVFLCLPHTYSMRIAPGIIKTGLRVIDLSADYRIRDLKTYSAFYKRKHSDSLNAKSAVYGIAELHREKIKKAKLLANPGCYPTAAILSLAPLVASKSIDASSIIIDAKSGVSGAGKERSEELFSSPGARQDFKAYKVGVHQHTPEINQELSLIGKEKISVSFVPHLLPIHRGILETIYAKKKRAGKRQGVIRLYRNFYKNEPFVRIKEEGGFPAIKDVANTNFCDIGIRETEGNYIIVSAIDNLLKGASGQAVQNMNIMCGFPETLGLL